MPRHGVEGWEPRCFAGTTSWHDPVLCWHHDLDLDLEGSGGDEGTVEWGGGTWGGGDLVERGSVGEVGYVEVWGRVDLGPSPAVTVEDRDDGPGSTVRIGPLAVTIADDRATGGGFLGRHTERVDGRWITRHEITA